MQRLEVSGAVRPIYGSLGVKRLNCTADNVRNGTSVVAGLISGTVIVSWMNFFDHLGNGWNLRSQKKQVCLPQIPQREWSP